MSNIRVVDQKLDLAYSLGSNYSLELVRAAGLVVVDFVLKFKCFTNAVSNWQSLDQAGPPFKQIHHSRLSIPADWCHGISCMNHPNGFGLKLLWKWI